MSTTTSFGWTSNPNHLINGNDGGINVSWDGGDSWIKCNSPSVGQFYAVEVDQADPYRIYGGLQDNGTWVGDHTHRESPAWHQTGHHGFTSLGGGDGMQIEVDSRDNEVVYTGYQFGWYMRTDRTTGERASLHPSHALGETPLRWNWQTPLSSASTNKTCSTWPPTRCTVRSTAETRLRREATT